MWHSKMREGNSKSENDIRHSVLLLQEYLETMREGGREMKQENGV